MIIFYILTGMTALWLLTREKSTETSNTPKPGETTLPIDCDPSKDPAGCWKDTLDKGLAPGAGATSKVGVAWDGQGDNWNAASVSGDGAFDLGAMPPDVRATAKAALDSEEDMAVLLTMADETEEAGYPMAALRFRKKAFTVAKTRGVGAGEVS